MEFPIQTLSQLRPILQGFRKENALTQAALAEKIGITQQSYAALEANPGSVSVERLFKVLALLNVGVVLTNFGSQDIQGKSAATSPSSMASNDALDLAPQQRPDEPDNLYNKESW